MSMHRTLTKKHSQRNVSDSKRKSIKNNISAPVALVSTTNMLSYTAPSLRISQSQSSLSSSSSSGSPTSTRFPTSPLSASSGDDTDIDSPRLTNPLAQIFQRPAPEAAPVRSQSTRVAKPAHQSHQRRPSAPAYPAPRPNMPMSPPPSTLPPLPRMPRSSTQHPFGAELAQVDEMAEEMGFAVRDAEAEFMESRGLQRYNASDYEQEIFGNVFEDKLPENVEWI